MANECGTHREDASMTLPREDRLTASRALPGEDWMRDG